MGPFLLRRLLTFLVTLWVASAVVFAVLELLPGNAAEVILGDTATPESLAALADGGRGFAWMALVLWAVATTAGRFMAYVG